MTSPCPQENPLGFGLLLGCSIQISSSSEPHPWSLFLGFAALAEGDDFRWVDGVAVDLHFDDFAALVDQIVDAAGGFVLGIVKTVLLGDVAAPIAQKREG